MLRPAIPNRGSISSTFYKHLLRAKIPKARKKIIKLSSFIALLGSACVKAARRTLVKLTPSATVALELNSKNRLINLNWHLLLLPTKICEKKISNGPIHLTQSRQMTKCRVTSYKSTFWKIILAYKSTWTFKGRYLVLTDVPLCKLQWKICSKFLDSYTNVTREI